VPMLTSFVRRAGLPRCGVRWDRIRQVCCNHAVPPRALSLWSRVGHRRLRLVGRARASVISELALPHEAPGFGAECSRLVVAFEARAPFSGDRER
jgi:hypothetical protein